VDRILSEWLGYNPNNGIFLGPWKIRISDIELFKTVEFVIKHTLETVGKKYPDDIACFYIGEKSIWHPTEDELKRFIK
jgi:protein-tyrosine phosphatase